MPIFDPQALEFISRSPEQTRRLGYRLGSLLESGDLIGLSGELGTGKTTMVQGIAQGWGSLDAVSSPTFVLVNTYRRPDGCELYHLDAYRLQNALEAEELDIDSMIENGTLVVEWPEHIRAALGTQYLWIEFTWLADEQRGLVFKPQGERYVSLMAEFRRRTFGG